jgi:hypothetical protein
VQVVRVVMRRALLVAQLAMHGELARLTELAA